MPRVRFKPAIEHIQGTFYDVVFKLSPQGKPIVTKRPDMSNVEWSEARVNQRRRFSQANEYAKAAMADPRVRLLYEEMAARENRRPYRVAFSDYCNGNNLLSGLESANGVQTSDDVGAAREESDPAEDGERRSPVP